MQSLKRSTNLVKKVYEGLGNYLSPSNFTYLWSLGSMALICLIIQIISGIFISMFYKADINMAFTSVEYINRELYYGWLVRYIHMNGASIFFLVVYLHMSKHILYGSYTYPRQVLWFSGMIIFILMMATAFVGYVLPWGQMSLWGATVITNIFSAIPVIGIDFVYWLWGGLSVENATLSRFYSLHFLLPFVILALSFIHLVFLHEFGSNNPLGIISKTDNIPFYLNYIIKDLYSWICLFFFFSYFVFFNVNFFGHPDNYIAGDFMVTPTQIVPEWYFLRAPMRSFHIRRSNWSTSPLSMDFKPTCSPKREIWRGQQHAGKGWWILLFKNNKSTQGKITMYLKKISGKLYRPYSGINTTVIWEIIKIGKSFIMDRSQTQLTQRKERFDAKVVITKNIYQIINFKRTLKELLKDLFQLETKQ